MDREIDSIIRINGLKNTRKKELKGRMYMKVKKKIRSRAKIKEVKK